MTKCCSATVELQAIPQCSIPRGSSLESRNSGPERPATPRLSQQIIYSSRSLCEVVQASCAPIMACYGFLASHPALRNLSPLARASAWWPSPAPAAHVSLCSASRLVFPSVNPTFSNHSPRRAGKWGLGWEEKGPPTAAVCLKNGKAGGTWADGPPHGPPPPPSSLVGASLSPSPQCYVPAAGVARSQLLQGSPGHDLCQRLW